MSRSSGAFGCARAPRVHERVGLRELPQPPYIPPVLFFYATLHLLSLIHISEPTRRADRSRMPSSA